MPHLPCRLTGSFVPDLIVSLSHQMWLHLQSDESVGSIGFKINYKGTLPGTDGNGCSVWLCAASQTCPFLYSFFSGALSVFLSSSCHHSFCLTVCLSVCQSLCLCRHSFCLSVSLSVFVVFLSFCLSVCLSVSLCLSVFLSL